VWEQGIISNNEAGCTRSDTSTGVAITNVPILGQDMNVGFYIFEEIKMFQYLGTLIRGKHEISEEI
jgi:hypothetical protein